MALGYSIGIFAVINTYQQELTRCDKFMAQSACDGARTIGNCQWKDANDLHHTENFADLVSGNNVSSGGVCVYPDNATEKCAVLNTSDSCAAHSGCGWVKQPEKGDVNCQPTGERWSPVLVGLYSTLSVVGSTLAGPISPRLLSKGRKPTLYTMAVLSLVGQLLLSAGWHWNSYAVQVVSRIITGIGGGIACVVGPIYAAEKQGHHEWIGCMFQMGVVTGIVVPAILGAILDPSSATGSDGKFGGGAHTQAMLQVVIHVGTLLLLVIFPIIFAAPESLERDDDDDNDDAGVDENGALVQTHEDAEGTPARSGCREVIKYIVPIVAVCGTQQLTGINAIMNYAPQIMQQVGVRPLLGNMLLMLWNFITTPVSIPLVKRMKPKWVYYVCGALVTVAAFLAFIPSYPGIIPSGGASQGLGLFAIFFFVAAFAVGVGPCFFILAQDMFPKHLMDLGTSVTITVTLIFNVLVNFSFPVLVKLFGGADDDEAKGQAFTFLVFGILGVVCCGTMFKTLPKLRSEVDAEGASIVPDAEECQEVSVSSPNQ